MPPARRLRCASAASMSCGKPRGMALAASRRATCCPRVAWDVIDHKWPGSQYDFSQQGCTRARQRDLPSSQRCGDYRIADWRRHGVACGGRAWRVGKGHTVPAPTGSTAGTRAPARRAHSEQCGRDKRNKVKSIPPEQSPPTGAGKTVNVGKRYRFRADAVKVCGTANLPACDSCSATPSTARPGHRR